jgi:hypothetical protein
MLIFLNHFPLLHILESRNALHWVGYLSSSLKFFSYSFVSASKLLNKSALKFPLRCYLLNNAQV